MLDRILRTFFIKVEIKDKRKEVNIRRCRDIRGVERIKNPEETTVLSGYFKNIKGLTLR